MRIRSAVTNVATRVGVAPGSVPGTQTYKILKSYGDTWQYQYEANLVPTGSQEQGGVVMLPTDAKLANRVEYPVGVNIPDERSSVFEYDYKVTEAGARMYSLDFAAYAGSNVTLSYSEGWTVEIVPAEGVKFLTKWLQTRVVSDDRLTHFIGTVGLSLAESVKSVQIRIAFRIGLVKPQSGYFWSGFRLDSAAYIEGPKQKSVETSVESDNGFVIISI